MKATLILDKKLYYKIVGGFYSKPAVAGDRILSFPLSLDDIRDVRGAYLLGKDRYEGIIRQYLSGGFEVEVIREDYFILVYKKAIKPGAYYDFLLSSFVDSDVIKNILWKGGLVFGWSPLFFINKKHQHNIISCSRKLRKLLPAQMFFDSYKDMLSIDTAYIQKAFSSKYLILKSYYSAMSRMPDGSGYMVFTKEAWPNILRAAENKKSWFEFPNGVIVSEFKESGDVFLENKNGVVHKFHIKTGLKSAVKKKSFTPLEIRLRRTPFPTGFTCDKMIASVALERCDSPQYFENIIEMERWERGSLDNYKDIISRLEKDIFQMPCLFSVDCIIDAKGRLFFLELNRNPATFLNRGAGNTAILGEYIDIILNSGITNRRLKEAFSGFEKLKNKLNNMS
ncbi:MAG: hypothetical protein V1933_00590 [Candidatus Omnitrophota bacterium]